MTQLANNSGHIIRRDGTIAVKFTRFASRSCPQWLVVGFAALVTPASSNAESQAGAASARASLNFRIDIPAIIRARPVAQLSQIVIEDHHVEQGYIDVDAATTVKLTINTRTGYLLTARYDAQLLSGIEIRLPAKSFIVSSGFGSMRIASDLATDQLVQVGYRLNLAPGVEPGAYRWPVALAFSLSLT